MEKSKRLSLDSYYLDDLKVAPNAAFHNDGNVSQPPVSLDFQSFLHSTNGNLFAMSLTIKSEEPITQDQPLRFSITIVGFFTVEEPIVEGKLPPERAVNALTILYGIARGYLGTTGGWFDRTMVLPTVYFSDVIQDRLSAAKRDEVNASEAPQLEAAVQEGSSQ